jgi:DNA invertase Pin-like site-specific DNA recombinase
MSLIAKFLSVNNGGSMAAVVYLRVSTDEQGERGYGLDAQETACRLAAERLGLSIAAVHIDAGVSGASDICDRPALLTALAAVRRGDVLLVAKRDRIARDQFVTLQVERMVAQRGARIVSAAGEGTDAAGDDIGGLIQRRMLDLFAEVERQMIRARTKAALAEKKRKGERVSGAIPYGYALAADGIHLLPCDREQEIIALVRSLRADGATFRAIVAAMNTNNVATRTGNAWQLRQIQNILATAPAIN